MRKDPTEFRARFKAYKEGKMPYENGLPKYEGGKQPKGDGQRYLWDDQTQEWDRITNSDVANAMAEWAFTPTTTRAKFDYENTPNPVKPLQNNTVISQDNNAWTKQRVAEESNKRTWLSDAADVSHAIGEGAMLASNFVPFEGQLVEGANWLGALAKSYIKHPNYITAYHGSPYPFDIKNAWTATTKDLGLHVGGNRRISETMANGGGVVYKLRIPKPNTETIDIGANGFQQLSNNFFMKAHPYDELSSAGYFDTTEGDFLKLKLLRQQGAKPTVIGNKLYTEKDASLPIRTTAYPNIPERELRNVNEIFREARMKTITEDLFGRPFETLPEDVKLQLNQRANDILSRSGYKVIAYNNSNPFEGGGGLSYMITDPSIIDVIQNMPKLKPLMWPTAVDAAYTLNK